jgi:hypothetical protein
MSDEYTREQKIESLEYDEAVKVVYQWVIQKTIDLNEFKRLLSCVESKHSLY